MLGFCLGLESSMGVFAGSLNKLRIYGVKGGLTILRESRVQENIQYDARHISTLVLSRHLD